MNALNLINPPSVFIEISQAALAIMAGNAGAQWPLARQENGRLTEACRRQLAAQLREFLKAQPRQARTLCAIGARGVSLRRLKLPAASKEEIQRLLPLQIESEFPLPPDQLAWGYLPVANATKPELGAAATQELLIAAVKKEALNEYGELLTECGLDPVFTLGAMARSFLCAGLNGSFAVLDIGRASSELIVFDGGAPSLIRVLPWGNENLTNAIAQSLGASREEAERLKLQPAQDSAFAAQIRGVIEIELAGLARLLDPKWVGQRLYLCGDTARLKELAPRLPSVIGNGMPCEILADTPGDGHSAAVLGLKKCMEAPGEPALLVLQIPKARPPESLAPAAAWKWAALAVALAFGCLVFRYAEAVLFKPRLERRLAEINMARQKLPPIDRELVFLQYLKTNQPPHLDTLTLIANAAPGTKVDSFSLNRRGDVSLRASMRDAQQVTDLRSKLIESGFFAAVTVEEQAPAPDGQKIAVRISGQLKPAHERKPIALESSTKEGDKPKTLATDAKPSTGTNAPALAPKASGASPPR